MVGVIKVRTIFFIPKILIFVIINDHFNHQHSSGQQCRKSFPARAWSGANYVIQKQNCAGIKHLRLHADIKPVTSLSECIYLFPTNCPELD